MKRRSTQELVKMYQLHKQGNSPAKIAKEMGLGITSVLNPLRSLERVLADPKVATLPSYRKAAKEPL